MKSSFGFFLSVFPILAHGHGYLKSPRSRNYVAYEDGVWSGGDASIPPKETCAHCLNRGGSAGQCGISESGKQYDLPQSVLGNVLPPLLQASYSPGQVIDVEVVLTAHHKGHFEFHACPITHGEIPPSDCFEPLEFVEDLLYRAPKDENFPERAYIPPVDMGVSSNGGPTPGQLFQYRYKLPDFLQGDLVLLQWKYQTANSCVYEGYDSYPFPMAWSDPVGGLGLCQNIPADGDGVPEQFWNCAEVRIESAVTSPTPDQSVATPSPTENVSVPTPTKAPNRILPAPTTTLPTGEPIGSPVSTPTPGHSEPTTASNQTPCCPNGLTALLPLDGCRQFYHCVDGQVVGNPMACPVGTLFDESLSNCNWDSAVHCEGAPPCE